MTSINLVSGEYKYLFTADGNGVLKQRPSDDFAAGRCSQGSVVAVKLSSRRWEQFVKVHRFGYVDPVTFVRHFSQMHEDRTQAAVVHVHRLEIDKTRPLNRYRLQEKVWYTWWRQCE